MNNHKSLISSYTDNGIHYIRPMFDRWKFTKDVLNKRIDVIIRFSIDKNGIEVSLLNNGELVNVYIIKKDGKYAVTSIDIPSTNITIEVNCWECSSKNHVSGTFGIGEHQCNHAHLKHFRIVVADTDYLKVNIEFPPFSEENHEPNL